MTQLVWSKAKPTEPGWYWLRCGGKVEVIEVWKARKYLKITQWGGRYEGDDWDTRVDKLAECEWSGPIPEPKTCKTPEDSPTASPDALGALVRCKQQPVPYSSYEPGKTYRFEEVPRWKSKLFKVFDDTGDWCIFSPESFKVFFEEAK